MTFGGRYQIGLMASPSFGIVSSVKAVMLVREMIDSVTHMSGTGAALLTIPCLCECLLAAAVFGSTLCMVLAFSAFGGSGLLCQPAEELVPSCRLPPHSEPATLLNKPSGQ